MPPNNLPEEDHTLQFGVSRFALALLLIALAILIVAAMVQDAVSTALPPGTGSALWTIATDTALATKLRLCFMSFISCAVLKPSAFKRADFHW